MKRFQNIHVSLIIKITTVVFLAFLFVVANEMRLGIDCYMKNTVETNAESIVLQLDKFAKSYAENIAINEVDLTGDTFQRSYNFALSGDTTKIKCLTDKEGNIIDISREGIENPTLTILINGDDGKETVSVDLSSLQSEEMNHEEAISGLEFYLSHDTSASAYVTINLIENTLEDTLERKHKNNDALKNIEILSLEINSDSADFYTVYADDYDENDENIISYIGVLSSYSSDSLEVTFATQITSSVLSSYFETIEESYCVIQDYNDSIAFIQNAINSNNLSDVFDNTSFGSQIVINSGYLYADYYLVNNMKYMDKTYSTVVMRLVDYTLVEDKDVYSTDEMTCGYIFVVTEYEDLFLNSFSSYFLDNSSTYLMVLLFIIIISIMIAYMVVKPIRSIETTTKHLTLREFDYPIDTSRHDELGDLSRDIKKMSEELEKTINTLYQEIERANALEAMRKEFTSNFTHEIKTPLGIINGFSELIELENDETKRNEYIKIIQTETKRINELVLAMLDLSKLESENVNLDITTFDLLDIVDDTIETMTHLFNQTHIHLKTYLDSCEIEADEFKIEMVISNFISNALHYTDEGHTVTIKLSKHRFEVENEGKHIPEDELKKIWLSFHKVDKSRSDQGTGLGLSICRAVLDLHQFRYGVENTEKGVLFYFEF
ncbi:MAG: HAMP domain-containing histidine kinase [Erysipelotrichaceae bacterium]|nr:HAMP domain-containing histidine kinase [Erysipelotrichaceae bacterium]